MPLEIIASIGSVSFVLGYVLYLILLTIGVALLIRRFHRSNQQFNTRRYAIAIQQHQVLTGKVLSKCQTGAYMRLDNRLTVSYGIEGERYEADIDAPDIVYYHIKPGDDIELLIRKTTPHQCRSLAAVQEKYGQVDKHEDPPRLRASGTPPKEGI